MRSEQRRSESPDLQNSIIPVGDKGHIEIRPLTTDELPPETLDAFLAVGFTNHYEILAQKKDVEQRLFYIVNCATGFWNGDKLKYYMKDDLFGKRGNMPNNFAKTIANVDLRSKALRSFKDEYLHHRNPVASGFGHLLSHALLPLKGCYMRLASSRFRFI